MSWRADYRPRHAAGTNHADLPCIMRGLTDLITVIDSEDDR